MAVRPSVRYFDSRGAYYCQIDRKQHLLAKGPDDFPDGPTYKAAMTAFHRLTCAAGADVAGDANTVETVVSRYLFDAEKVKRPKTVAVMKSVLNDAIRAFGDVRVADVRPTHVNDWLAGKRQEASARGDGPRKGWSETTCRTAFLRLRTAFRWARLNRLTQSNPLEGVSNPFDDHSRGADYVLPPRLRSLLIAEASGSFGLALRLLEATGARPAEVFRCEARNVSGRKIIYRWNATSGYTWKNARKSKSDRVIYLPEQLAAELAILAKNHPDGPLFRSAKRGGAYAVGSQQAMFRCLRNRPSVRAFLAAEGRDPETVILYGFRHTYITDWLRARMNIHACAVACGTSVEQIEKHYSHLSKDLETMEQLTCSFASIRPE